MQRVSFLLLLCFNLIAVSVTAQQDTLPNALPNLTVKNIGGQIVVSWVNNYRVTVTAINIQRSYDSLRNYTTIGSVLNPQSEENGFADANPPYNKMYYRVFISFDGGSYQFSKVVRPVKEVIQVVDAADTSFPFLAGGRDKSTIQGINDPRQKGQIPIIPKTNLPPINNTEIITYPSRRIYTGKDNNIIIYLPDAETKKYTVKFFDENDAPVFDLNKLHEQYLIIEKVNFVHAGWFYFEIYENGKIIEKNRFYIPKDGKNPGPPPEPIKKDK